MAKEAKKRYANKCMVRTITFYLKDKDIYDFSKTINFQEFVKDTLTNALNDALITGRYKKHE